MGKSSLSAGHETALTLPDKRFGIEGRGTLRGTGGNLDFFYAASEWPISSSNMHGYFVIYHGTGVFARATGGGTWHETQGPTALTDAFDG